MSNVRYPSLYQINTRVWLTELSRTLGRKATLDDIPDTELDRIAALGFDWVWFLSVWQTGAAGQQVSRTNPQWRKEFEETLPDLREEDIIGSGFAITGYTVHTDLGCDAALARLRERLRKRGLKLMLDFVPNHMGLDHPWIEDHPEHFVNGTEQDLANAAKNFTRVKRKNGDLILAHGRDPYFDGWPDTLQLNYGNPETQKAMLAELVKISAQCDGVRCDMAMLILPEVFDRTWHVRPEPFWPKAIQRVRDTNPGFCFMAEVYWDMEWTLQQQGFDYTYDKRIYDRLLEGHARPVREHFIAGLDYQNKLARFLENHDEPRAATAFPRGMHEAAAVITFLSPGFRFFHQGQFEGRRKRISPHLGRGPDEPTDDGLKNFYDRLLTVVRQPVVRGGEWRLLECRPAWDGNGSNDCFVAFSWESSKGDRLVAVINYAQQQSQCYVPLPFADMKDARWQLKDQLSDASYDRDGNEIVTRGLYLDLAPWQSHAFSLIKLTK